MVSRIVAGSEPLVLICLLVIGLNLWGWSCATRVRPWIQMDGGICTLSYAECEEILSVAESFLSHAQSGDTLALRAMADSTQPLEWAAAARSHSPALLDAAVRKGLRVLEIVESGWPGVVLGQFEIPVRTQSEICYLDRDFDEVQMRFRRSNDSWHVLVAVWDLC
jgi:hypothetical protein